MLDGLGLDAGGGATGAGKKAHYNDVAHGDTSLSVPLGRESPASYLLSMSLTLHFRPFASYCQKVLIALYENETPFERVVVDLGFFDLYVQGPMQTFVRPAGDKDRFGIDEAHGSSRFATGTRIWRATSTGSSGARRSRAWSRRPGRSCRSFRGSGCAEAAALRRPR